MSTAVLLSGGVDSSVALRLLQEAGHGDLTAFYLKIWLEDELAYLGECPWEEDLRYARAVACDAGVPLEVVSLQREYRERVVSYTLAELREGRTPSPDIFCNERIKFGAFLDVAGGSFDRVASGHYARVARDGMRHLLQRGVDRVKDQTYFLARLGEAQLARALFPLGALRKSEVRRLAARFGLSNRDRPDSQGICFLGRVRFESFVEHHLGTRPGEIREHGTGRTLGEHRGYWFYTIGQRRGLGLSGGPWYVVSKDTERNFIGIAHARDLAAHSRGSFRVAAPHWIAGPPRGERLEAKLRHGERTFPCALHEEPEGTFRVVLDGVDPGIAPGQFAVFYDGEICAGSAAITSAAV